MNLLKFFLLIGLGFVLLACSAPPPDFSGEWEQNDTEHTIKRVLTITKDGEQYHILDEVKDVTSGEVSYDEKSNGVIDGQQLLTGTNTLTNVLSLDAQNLELTMKTHDDSILVFKKIN